MKNGVTNYELNPVQRGKTGPSGYQKLNSDSLEIPETSQQASLQTHCADKQM